MMLKDVKWGRILSAGSTLGEFSPDGYSIFDRGESDKDIIIWQPGGTINDVSSLASPGHEMKNKAELFLKRANGTGCQLAAGPELAYDVNWVMDHAEYLFAEDSPLFVLGCAPIREDTRKEVIETLEGDFDVEEAGDIECNPDEFITPTIIPIKATFRQDSSSDAVLIQYKNQPMSDSVIPTEQANLVEGEAIWKIDPRDNSTVIAWTCSDVMDADLRECVQREARLNDTYVVHVQCNPDPFNETWIDFRNQAFDGSDHKVTYICSNWGNVRLEEMLPGSDTPVSTLRQSAVHLWIVMIQLMRMVD